MVRVGSMCRVGIGRYFGDGALKFVMDACDYWADFFFICIDVFLSCFLPVDANYRLVWGLVVSARSDVYVEADHCRAVIGWCRVSVCVG